MKAVTAAVAKANLYSLISSVNENCSPTAIASDKRKGAILIGEDEWAAIEETLHLGEVPGISATRTARTQKQNEVGIAAD